MISKTSLQVRGEIKEVTPTGIHPDVRRVNPSRAQRKIPRQQFYGGKTLSPREWNCFH